MNINVRYISNFIFIWIFYFNMINSKSKIKKIIWVIRGPKTFGDPLLLLREGMKILSSNSDADGEGTGKYAKYRGWVRGDWSPPLPSPLPSLPVVPKCDSDNSCVNCKACVCVYIYNIVWKIFVPNNIYNLI